MISSTSAIPSTVPVERHQEFVAARDQLFAAMGRAEVAFRAKKEAAEKTPEALEYARLREEVRVLHAQYQSFTAGAPSV